MLSSNNTPNITKDIATTINTKTSTITIAVIVVLVVLFLTVGVFYYITNTEIEIPRTCSPHVIFRKTNSVSPIIIDDIFGNNGDNVPPPNLLNVIDPSFNPQLDRALRQDYKHNFHFTNNGGLCFFNATLQFLMRLNPQIFTLFQHGKELMNNFYQNTKPKPSTVKKLLNEMVEKKIFTYIPGNDEIKVEEVLTYVRKQKPEILHNNLTDPAKLVLSVTPGHHSFAVIIDDSDISDSEDEDSISNDEVVKKTDDEPADTTMISLWDKTDPEQTIPKQIYTPDITEQEEKDEATSTLSTEQQDDDSTTISTSTNTTTEVSEEKHWHINPTYVTPSAKLKGIMRDTKITKNHVNGKSRITWDVLDTETTNVTDTEHTTHNTPQQETQEQQEHSITQDYTFFYIFDDMYPRPYIRYNIQYQELPILTIQEILRNGFFIPDSYLDIITPSILAQFTKPELLNANEALRNKIRELHYTPPQYKNLAHEEQLLSMKQFVLKQLTLD